MIYCHVAKISGIFYYVTCCYAAEISSVGWGWGGVGWGGMLTFLVLRTGYIHVSVGWGWGGVGWGVMLTFLVLRTGYIATLLRSLGSFTTWHVATLLRSLGSFTALHVATLLRSLGSFTTLHVATLPRSLWSFTTLQVATRYECHNGNLLSKTASTLMDRWADEECEKKSAHPRLMHMMFTWIC